MRLCRRATWGLRSLFGKQGRLFASVCRDRRWQLRLQHQLLALQVRLDYPDT